MEGLQRVNGIIAWVHFSITLLAEITVLVRSWRRLDLSMMIISASFLVAFIVRLPYLSTSVGTNLMTIIAFHTIWLTLYFFIFEMRRFLDQITSEDLQEHVTKAKKT